MSARRSFIASASRVANAQQRDATACGARTSAQRNERETTPLDPRKRASRRCRNVSAWPVACLVIGVQWCGRNGRSQNSDDDVNPIGGRVT